MTREVCWECGGSGGRMSTVDNMAFDVCPACEGKGYVDISDEETPAYSKGHAQGVEDALSTLEVEYRQKSEEKGPPELRPENLYASFYGALSAATMFFPYTHVRMHPETRNELVQVSARYDYTVIDGAEKFVNLFVEQAETVPVGRFEFLWRAPR